MKTTIHTKKEAFQNDELYIQEKQKLFQNLTSSIIISELAHHGIFLSKEDIVKEYKKCFDIDHVIDIFDKQYDCELEQLGKLNEVFDDDALVYLILKVIEECFDVHTLPDKAYIARDIQEMIHKPLSYEQLLDNTLHIMKRLVTLKQYEKQDHLAVIFLPYMLDIDQFFIRIFENINQYDVQFDLLQKLNDFFVN